MWFNLKYTSQSCPHYPSALWRFEQWRVAPSPSPSVPGAELANGQESGSVIPEPPSVILRRVGSTSRQRGTIESTLPGQVWVSQLQNHEGGTAVPITHLPCGNRGRKEVSLLPLINAGGRWKKWPGGHKSGRATPDPYKLQHSGEQVLHLSRAAH